ncbi:MAG TPA: tyrosine-protein phosphatase [Blastocatellia bacterium]|nr:tyrosine-protein phosphatase [Blastocatellia bacterium]
MNRRIAAFAKMPRINFLKAGLASLLIILAFSLLKPSSVPEDNGAKPEVAAAGDASQKLTAPSSFPNITIDNFGQMDEHFYRGAQPKPEDYKALAALGIKTIVDLRDDPTSYEKREAEASGMRYVSIPMSDKKKPAPEKIEAFLAIVNDDASQPFYVHCIGGRHRTGLIGAVYRYNKYGWDFDQVYREMKNYDYYSRWGHGAIKDYVKEYYDTMKAAKAAAIVTTAPAIAPLANAPAEPNAQPSQPVTEAPPPKPTE